MQKFTAGQVQDMLIWIRIPHAGTVNVSVVDTKTNRAIWGPLVSFSGYVDQALPTVPKGNTNFGVIILKGLGERCAAARQCVRSFRSLLANGRGRVFGRLFSSDSKNCR